MGIGAGLYIYDVVVKKFTFAISSSDEFLYIQVSYIKSLVLRWQTTPNGLGRGHVTHFKKPWASIIYLEQVKLVIWIFCVHINIDEE